MCARIYNTLLCILPLIVEMTCDRFMVKIITSSDLIAGCPVTLLCMYSIDLRYVYSIHWYRGSYSFYRYFPRENPPGKANNREFLSVDAKLSNATHVTLKNVSYSVSGEFSCEVTADEPVFTTIKNSALLHISELSRVQRPVITTETDVYNTRDNKSFFINCSILFPITRAPITSYSVHFYQDDKQINSKLISKMNRNINVLDGRSLKWDFNLKCFNCELSICDTYKMKSDSVCISSVPNGSKELPQSLVSRYVFLCTSLFAIVSHMVVAL